MATSFYLLRNLKRWQQVSIRLLRNRINWFNIFRFIPYMFELEEILTIETIVKVIWRPWWMWYDIAIVSSELFFSISKIVNRLVELLLCYLLKHTIRKIYVGINAFKLKKCTVLYHSPYGFKWKRSLQWGILIGPNWVEEQLSEIQEESHKSWTPVITTHGERHLCA